jgi:molybdopterin-guanine dinucleotide biosynthesis protein A
VKLRGRPEDANTTQAPVGIVLAGGDSRRMGRDKALLTLGEGGETLAAGAARRLAAVCAEVGVADRERSIVPGLPSLADGPGRGPAAGLLGASRHWPDRPLLALACDLPAVPIPLLVLLKECMGHADWVVPRWSGGLEPLCSLWGPAALAALAERVERGLYALHSLSGEAGLSVRYLEGAQLAAAGRPEEMFRNVNTPEDLEPYTSSAPSGTPPQRSQGQISRRKS